MEKNNTDKINTLNKERAEVIKRLDKIEREISQLKEGVDIEKAKQTVGKYYRGTSPATTEYVYVVSHRAIDDAFEVYEISETYMLIGAHFIRTSHTWIDAKSLLKLAEIEVTEEHFKQWVSDTLRKERDRFYECNLPK